MTQIQKKTHTNQCRKPEDFSVVQLTEEGHSSLDPVIYWNVSGQMDGKDKVGGVTGSGQCTSPLAGLVERADVVSLRLEVGFYTWFDPDDRNRVKENLW